MPWTPEDASKHNKRVKTPKHKRMWADVANSVLKSTGSESRAIREANAAVDRQMKPKRRAF